MIKEEVKLRVRYSETDRMGFVYYGNYAQYFEVARVAAMKRAGVSYKKLEDSGIGMPVKDLKIEYLQAAQYDDELTISCEVRTMPSSRIVFYYTIERGEDCLVKGETTLFFMNLKSLKAIRPPEFFVDQMKSFFS
jgi:acyl-CoA thioester hydrolase